MPATPAEAEGRPDPVAPSAPEPEDSPKPFSGTPDVTVEGRGKLKDVCLRWIM